MTSLAVSTGYLSGDHIVYVSLILNFRLGQVASHLDTQSALVYALCAFLLCAQASKLLDKVSMQRYRHAVLVCVLRGV